jgi:hypothetical protein
MILEKAPKAVATYALAALIVAAVSAVCPAAEPGAVEAISPAASSTAPPEAASEAGAGGGATQISIAPARIFSLRDTPRDGGTSIDICWEPSPAEASAPGAVIEYKIMRADSPTGEYAEVGSMPAGTTAFSDGGTVPGKQYWYRVDSFGLTASTSSEVSGPAVSVMQWYNGRTSVLALVIFCCAAILVYITIARRKRGKVFVRRIPALDAFDEAIGRATEMG